MGLISSGMGRHETYLTYVTLALGFMYPCFVIVAYTLKMGYAWHDAGPIFGLPIKGDPYMNMILSIYSVLGLFYIRAAREGIKAHASLISFSIWANFAHGLVMLMTVLLGFYEAPYYILGLPANISPIGDVPFIFIISSVQLYLFKKTFGVFV